MCKAESPMIHTSLLSKEAWTWKHRPHFRLPLWIHALNIITILAIFASMRLPGLRSFLSQHVLSILPRGYYVQKFPTGYYEPLSMPDWFLHILTMAPNLEIIAAFWTLKNHYRTLAVMYMLAHVHGIATMTSHTLIGIDAYVEEDFMNWTYFLVRLQVFGLGIISILGWWIALGPLIYLIATDVLTFESIYGQGAATLSMMVMVVSTKNHVIPPLFKVGWMTLACMPVLFPDDSNDAGHTLGAFMLNVPLVFMALTMNDYVKQEEEQQQKRK